MSKPENKPTDPSPNDTRGRSIGNYLLGIIPTYLGKTIG
jgi:hypothetical protein